MRKPRRATMPLSVTLIAVLLSLENTAMCTASAEPKTTCEHAELLSAHPLSEIPEATQVILRRAVRIKLEAIIHDPGMGMKDTVLEKIPLKAIEIARTSKSDALYVVAWDDDSFGVNGFNWVVEVKSAAAELLLSEHASSLAGGFGVKVLGSSDQKYPEIMIPSKGFAEGGGALAEPGCFQKLGRFYEKTSCPASCYDELNPK